MAALTIPYDASEALQQVRSVINEVTADFWTDEQINNWVIEGSALFSTLTHCFKTTGDITLVAGTFEYSTFGASISVATIIKLHAATYYTAASEQVGLVNVNPRVFGRNDFEEPGPTQGYCLFGNKILITPTPTATEVTATGKVKLFYSKIASGIGDIPDHLQIYIIHYAIAMALYKRNKGALASQFFSTFLSGAQFEGSDLILQPTDIKSEFTQPDLVM